MRFRCFADLLALEPNVDLLARLRVAESVGWPLGEYRQQIIKCTVTVTVAISAQYSLYPGTKRST